MDLGLLFFWSIFGAMAYDSFAYYGDSPPKINWFLVLVCGPFIWIMFLIAVCIYPEVFKRDE